MLVLEKLKFSNWFRFGENNEITFTNNRVTLLSGDNAAGKSSIVSIIEEMLFNKNSRGKKKDQIMHRGASYYSGELLFRKDSDQYRVVKEVKKTAKVTLYKNGVDISGNTATVTYKILEEIINKDFSSFSKLLYQSFGSSLDFLTLTDAKRKEFLVSLLNLERYVEIEEQIKADVKQAETEVLALTRNAESLSKLTKPIQETALEVIPVPDLMETPVDPLYAKRYEVSSEFSRLLESMSTYKSKLDRAQKLSVEADNRFNNYKQTVSKLQLDIDVLLQNEPTQPSVTDYSELPRVTCEVTELRAELANIKKQYQHFKSDASITNCPVCNSSLDKHASANAANQLKEEYLNKKEQLLLLEGEEQILRDIELKTNQYSKWKRDLDAAVNKLDRYKTDNDLNKLKTDKDLFSDEFNKLLMQNPTDLEVKLNQLKTDEALIDTQIQEVQVQNRQYAEQVKSAELHNAKVTTFNAELEKRLANQRLAINEYNSILLQIKDKQVAIQELSVLQKAMKDLVMYRIEYASKSFEKGLNEYLVKLSEGNLVLQFQLDNAKLGVTVFDEGMPVDISELSTGQSLITKMATLLAIRQMDMDSVNLLFLDEVAATLTDDNKSLLINTLLDENYNTIMVNHSYTNPLCAYLHVNKGSPSRIETWH